MSPLPARLLPMPLLVLVLSCGGHAPSTDVIPTPAPTPTPDPVVTTQSHLAATCSDDPSALPCREALQGLKNLEAEIARAVRGEVFEDLCAQSTEFCAAFGSQLVKIGNSDEVAAQLARVLEAAGNEEPVSDTVHALLDLLCSPSGSWSTCESVVSSPALSDIAEDYRTRRRLWTALRAALDAPEGQGPLILANRLDGGAADLRPLFALVAAESGLTAKCRPLLRETVARFGHSGWQELAAAIREDQLSVAVVAAFAGWDPSQTETAASIKAEEPRRTMTLDEATSHIGRTIRLHHRNGSVREGVLKKIEDDVFVVEIPIGNGAMTTKVERKDIVRIQF